MLGIGKYAHSWFYIEYLVCTNVLSLWIKGCQLLRKCMWDATHKMSFASGLKDSNEMRKCIDYIIDNIFVLFCQGLRDVVVYDVQLPYAG